MRRAEPASYPRLEKQHRTRPDFFNEIGAERKLMLEIGCFRFCPQSRPLLERQLKITICARQTCVGKLYNLAAGLVANDLVERIRDDVLSDCRDRDGVSIAPSSSS
jgi:hypothetical protein